MKGTKKWYQSTGVTGGIAAIVAVLTYSGYDISQEEITNNLQLLDQLILTATVIVANIVSIYGRLSATKRIK